MQIIQVKKIIPVLFAATAMVFSCKKEEGKGGQATITGKVYAYDTDNNDIPKDSGYIAGVRVYIAYGDNAGEDDNTRSAYDGSYSFKWLQKGKYKVWVISKCDSCALEQETDLKDVEITDREETVTVPDLIFKY